MENYIDELPWGIFYVFTFGCCMFTGFFVCVLGQFHLYLLRQENNIKK